MIDPFITGRTFIHDCATGLPPHLWMIISDTMQSADVLVMVNFTSWEEDGFPAHNDPACIIEQDEHRFVTHKTCVSYRDAKITPVDNLIAVLNLGMIEHHDDLSIPLLEKVRRGILHSEFRSNKVMEFLAGQNLI